MTDDEDEKNCRSMIREMLNEGDGFTQWELDFLDSVNEWQGNLTPKQKDTIEKIYHRRM